MRRFWGLSGIVVLCGLLMAAGEYRSLKGGKNILITITNAGDTAKVYRIGGFTGRDSFDYIDTIYVERNIAHDSSESAVTWLSPLQVQRITLGSEFAGRFDTTLTVSCSLDMGTNRYGFDYTVNDGVTDTLFAIVIDSLVARWNAESGMSDTTIAHDSVTYIKIISKFANDSYLESADRWTLYLGDSVNRGDSVYTTVAMVVDSMIDAINADSIGSYVTATAHDDKDTAYLVSTNTKGWYLKVSPGDTAQDTTVTVARKTSVSVTTDSFYIEGGQTWGFKTLQADIVLRNQLSAEAGLGVADSAIVWLYAVKGHENYRIDSARCTVIPCTLIVNLHSNVGDTVLHDYLMVKYYTYDTLTEKNMIITYPMTWDITLK